MRKMCLLVLLLILAVPVFASVIVAVSSTVTVTANIASLTDISSVQFQLDGVNLGAVVTTPPYSISWDTTKVMDGRHTITAIATNVEGGTGTSTINVQVNNHPVIILGVN